MRVLVNEFSTSRTKAGIGHYTVQLLRCLRAQAPDDQIDGFPSPWFWQARDLGHRLRACLQRERTATTGSAAAKPPSGRAPGGWRAWCVEKSRWLGWAALESNFRLCFRRGFCDLYHEPNNIPLPADVPTVVTIHDLSVLLHPEWHPAYRTAEYEARFDKGLAQSCHILTDSEFIRQEIIQILGLRPERVTCVPLGVRPGLAPMPEADVQATLRRLGLPPRYFLCLGTIEPRKNVLTLLRAYVKLPPEVRERYPLVLAGGWGWNSADVAAFLDAEARHRGVVYTGYLAEEHLAAVLNGARALVYPSFYEGFGLPPVEMMACGGAVLCSTAGALVETVGARAHLIEPLDEDGWREALRLVAVDDDWHTELRRGATEMVRRFTWEQCAADTLGVYRAVCGQPATQKRPLRKAG